MDLKPCPFCGGEAEILVDSDRTSSKPWSLRCTGCGVDLRWYATQQEVRARWNMRIGEERLLEIELEKLFQRVQEKSQKP